MSTFSDLINALYSNYIVTREELSKKQIKLSKYEYAQRVQRATALQEIPKDHQKNADERQAWLTLACKRIDDETQTQLEAVLREQARLDIASAKISLANSLIVGPAISEEEYSEIFQKLQPSNWLVPDGFEQRPQPTATATEPTPEPTPDPNPDPEPQLTARQRRTAIDKQIESDILEYLGQADENLPYDRAWVSIPTLMEFAHCSEYLFIKGAGHLIGQGLIEERGTGRRGSHKEYRLIRDSSATSD